MVDKDYMLRQYKIKEKRQGHDRDIAAEQ
jgi:hypothetical protein